MASDLGKENIADGLVASLSFNKAPTLSPKKTSKRTRSKSIGPGGLGALEEPALKESSGNRRKSAFIPAVKSILASNDEDEKKRREERRKSLARRRVSFAPEATLHTWDVVEYLRDATTSSASSETTRRASNVSRASTRASPAPDSDAEEPPSTPPERVEEPEPELGSSPANQRDLHQKKYRRRSSGIPPMNFNNPDDVFSSSPLSEENSSPGRSDGIESSSEDGEDATAKMESPSDSNDSSESSARLEAALRQAAAHAGTQKLDLDENGDMSMELAEEEITAAFKPWAKKTAGTPKPTRNIPSFQDQKNMDPFSPAAKPKADIEPLAPYAEPEEDDGEEMSMDITRAVGRIVPQPPQQSPEQDDATMDLTMPLGSIQQAAPKEQANRRKSLKRRRSSIVEASQGSPAKRPASRSTSLRQRRLSDEESALDDATMDLTVAIGGIKGNATKEPARRSSVDTSFGDETMDFTVAAGSIKDAIPSANQEMPGSDQDEDEELSMEFTNVIGGIKAFEKQISTPEKPTIVKEKTPVKAKTPTPKKVPKKSPGRPRMSDVQVPQPSPKKAAQATPQKSPGRPQKSHLPATPELLPPPQQQIEDVEPSPFVRSAVQSASKNSDSISTPTNKAQYQAPKDIPDDPIAAPILNRRRSSLSSVQFSPLAAAREEPTLRSTALLTNNIKLLSTPRKQTLASPMKRGVTPKKAETPQKAPTPKQKTSTPKKPTPRKSISPKKRVAFGEDPPVQPDDAREEAIEEAEEEVERISLQEFLDMTKIRFMDLSTTKRRHTAAPPAFHDRALEEKEESLDQYVVSAACTLPEFELYQHACHEMKKFISDGRHFVRTMEANVMEDNPLLFSEYLTAPPDQRAIMDNQFKNLKTSARLEARGEWYGWRSTLLQDLKAGLLGTMKGFTRDESILTGQEKLLDSVLPPLLEQHERLGTECKQLQQRHDELNSCDREELEHAREQLVAADAELEEKRRLVAQLQGELAEKEARIEAAKERKIECVEEIKTADRVREECRGWSATEVNELKGKVTTLEQMFGWSITSASTSTITVTHLNDLELYFQPSAFATGENTPNASISLTYVGDTASPHPRPLTTSKRFFLQLIRAHLHCIPQSQTRIAELLALVKNGWATARAVAEGVRWLKHNYITEEFILSDERMAISSNMLLPTLQTKVKVTFDIGVSLSTQGVETQVGAKAELVYGEKYSEDKMGHFLRDFCGSELKDVKDMAIWAEAVMDLAGRLKATGRKGERA
ncbi:Spc7-domain-containing protein [Zopfia rhizophila CBS 207.26]|uniref:Spc7-domain-containing protein n=1 Tax=Zopfia rhizophila CBS 207.26 TaxID=1314779 RepID=A0A6A6ENM0_9PEZI|nr:Spc7-domain-containing protein [Zopfia rhizophila CBS 207.26]